MKCCILGISKFVFNCCACAHPFFTSCIRCYNLKIKCVVQGNEKQHSTIDFGFPYHHTSAWTVLRGFLLVGEIHQ